MEPIKSLIDRELVSTEEFNNTPGFSGSEAFFKFIDTVAGFCRIWQTLNAVEIVAFEFVFEGILDHVPLDGVLGVVLGLFIEILKHPVNILNINIIVTK